MSKAWNVVAICAGIGAVAWALATSNLVNEPPWSKGSTEQCDPEDLLLRGQAYESGGARVPPLMVPTVPGDNRVEAYKYYHLVVMLSEPGPLRESALAHRNALGGRMSKSDVASAISLADEWRSKACHPRHDPGE